MTHGNQVRLEDWFSDLNKKIDEYDKNLVIAEIQLRAIKDGLDPDSSDVLTVIKEFQAAVKAHNRFFNQQKFLDEQITKLRTQLAILVGDRAAKSASQRAFLAKSKKLGLECAIRQTRSLLEKREADRNNNPTHQLRKLQQNPEKPKHHQFMEVEGKPDWVHIECAGGCGRFVELRKKKVEFADYYVCNSAASGQQCETNLPMKDEGQVKLIRLNAAGSFTGITYQWPTPAEQASIARARGILAID